MVCYLDIGLTIKNYKKHIPRLAEKVVWQADNDNGLWPDDQLLIIAYTIEYIVIHYGLLVIRHDS